MSDQASNRPEDPLALNLAKGKSDSHFRLVTADGNIVFPHDGEPTDDSPTIISKNKPAETLQAASPNLSGSLRGRKLAHFELIEPIGVGGMAAVLRARDTQLERFVALKILPPDMAEDEENIRRFHQEARAAAKLDHENIARVFYCGEDQRLHFIAFEFVEGQNLRTYLEKRGRLPVGEAVRIILQIATGLEHAASRGVVHRDVKPSNIIISSNGRAKLVDMGLARSLEPQNDGALTQSGVTLGTFDYISPEQALEPREADSRSDIYSLGCTLYHMLTGQPPVPEGTAAKKLHHHQHVAPVDPRQLNPEVPDEIAMILARMMAKDVKERYQRPVHLVQHLMQVAQKVGAADDVPEGVLFVDAVMPADPRKRPLLLISLGALALAVVLMLQSLAPQPSVRPQTHNKALVKGPDKLAPAKDAPAFIPGKAGPLLVSSDRMALRSDLDLAQLLADKGPHLQGFLVKSIDLPEGGLVFQGENRGEGKRNLTIVCEDLDEPKAIRFKYAGKKEGLEQTAPMVAGLMLEGGAVTFRNIRFEIEAGETPTEVVASLGIQGSGTVLFHNCSFVQRIDVPPRKFILPQRKIIPIASIAVDNPGGTEAERPRVLLKQCSFTGGQVAVGVNGPAEILPTDCAFKPYGSLFHLRGGGSDYSTYLKLQRCSAFVINGPAFRVDENATCILDVAHCIFSRPDTAPSENRDEPDLIRQTDTFEPLVKFSGVRNCYHNLNALWVRPKQIGFDHRTELDDFRTLVLEAKGTGDQDSARLTKETPIWVSSQPWKEDSLQEAFRLRHDVREVRTADMRKALGFEQCENIVMAALAPLPVEETIAEAKLKPHEKVVDPDGAENPSAGIFKSLRKAMTLASPGDVILLKHGKNSRDVQINPTLIDQPSTEVTLRPYPGFAPVLNMGDTAESDAALFRMHEGKLTIEQLELVLDPDQYGFKAQAAVFMSGNASCVFRNCIFTLRPSDSIKHTRKVPLSVVTLADPEEAMMMPAQRSPRLQAEIHLHNCFIRGEGEVLTVRASRPFELDMDNTLVGLAGSLVGIQSAAKEPMPEAGALLKMQRVSALVTESVLAFRAGKNPKGFVPLRVEAAKDCLFACIGPSEKPFTVIEANDVTEDTLRGYLDWKGEHNAYGNFDKMLHTVRPEDGQSYFGLNSTRWIDFYREVDSKFPMVQLSLTPGAVRSLWTAVPEHFYPRAEFKEELTPFGVGLNLETLPRLTLAKKESLVAPE